MDQAKTTQALKTIFDQCGTNVLQNRRQFEACLEDLLPDSSSSTERLVLRHTLDSSALTLLLRAPNFTADAARRAVRQLRQESRMGVEDAEFVVRCVIAARGGDPNVLSGTVPDPPEPEPPKPTPPAPKPEPYVLPEPPKPKPKGKLIAAVTAAALAVVLLAVGIGSLAKRDTGNDIPNQIVDSRKNQEDPEPPLELDRTIGPTFTPGIYGTTTAGYGSSVKVNMTFDETHITDIRVDVSEETPGIGGSIGDQMASAILSAQSADVDVVSGATITSNAIKTAAVDCISQASGG